MNYLTKINNCILNRIRSYKIVLASSYKLYKLILKFYGVPLHLPIDYKGQAASDLIKNTLEADKPGIICRFGENELRTVVAYLNEKFNIKPNIRGCLRRESFSLEDKRVKVWMHNCAGFYPNDKTSLSQFSELTLKDMNDVDVLGCWLPREVRIKDYLNVNLKTIPLSTLAPWEHNSPWTLALKNKKVLIIHPFEKTIKKQYKKRELLFENKDILPEFKLITLKAVQSAAGNKTSFKTWFNALDYMCEMINTIDFDVAIIGAGAYGFSLAAHIKRIGKKAVHLGGATQLLFGIKGNRWDGSKLAVKYYNSNWTRPADDEKPQQPELIENNTYW